MNKKKSFVMYDEWGTLFTSLSDEVAGELIKAIFQHSRGEQPVIENEVLRAAFEMIASRIDCDKQKYTEVAEKRAEAARAKYAMQMDANASKCMQMEANASDKDKDKDKDKEKDKDIIINDNNKKSRRFTPPSLQEVREYCSQRGNKVDPEQFLDFYESKGWKVGAAAMKDWKAAVRTWEKRDTARKHEQNQKNRFNQFEQRDYDYDALEAELLGIGGTA